jgi:CRP-like cAMP-binding protein
MNSSTKRDRPKVPAGNVTRVRPVDRFDQLLLAHPEIQGELVDFLVNRTASFEVQLRTLHRAFVDACIRAGLQDRDYPLMDRSHGCHALERWVRVFFEVTSTFSQGSAASPLRRMRRRPANGGAR